MNNTYKLNQTRYPFEAFCRSDFSGKFHLIAVSLMKREEENAFVWFLTAIKNFCSENMGLYLEQKISYILIDASDA